MFFCCVNLFTLINAWMIGKKFNKTSLSENEHFYCHLNMEDTINADYTHAKRA